MRRIIKSSKSTAEHIQKYVAEHIQNPSREKMLTSLSLPATEFPGMEKKGPAANGRGAKGVRNVV